MPYLSLLCCFGSLTVQGLHNIRVRAFQAGARVHGQRVGQGARLQLLQCPRYAGEEPCNASPGAVQAIKKICFL